MQYNRATVTTTSEFSDTVSVLLIEAGSEGVSVTDYEDVKKVLAEHSWDYADETLLHASDGAAYVCGYFPANFDFAALNERLQNLRGFTELPVGSLELHIDTIDSADYENEWKKYYTPIELQKIVVVPEWLTYKGEKIPVYIDPGMAFGTGSHETTKLCLRFLEEQDIRGKRCADVGCGSGILGAAAIKLGASACYLSDIDAQAVEAAKRNCVRNGVTDRAEIVQGSLPESANGAFSLIVANITADVLVMLAEQIVRALRVGGRLIVSGIIHSRANDVIAAYAPHLTLLQVQKDGEWQGMLWVKKAAV